MRAEIKRIAMISLLGLSVIGCVSGGEARYVYQDGQFGVVGIPENTSRWPNYYRQQAEELMARHFPEGYEVVRAEEVVEGERTLTVGGTSSAEVGPGLPDALLRVAKLGRTATRNQSDQVKIKECRILYKKKEPGAPTRSGEFAERATWTPTLYVDPNEAARRHEVARPAFKGDGRSKDKEAADHRPSPRDGKGHADDTGPEPSRVADAPG
jgi:hypothetical protein